MGESSPGSFAPISETKEAGAQFGSLIHSDSLDSGYYAPYLDDVLADGQDQISQGGAYVCHIYAEA